MKRRAAVKCVAYELMSILILIQGYRMCVSDILSVSAAYGNVKVVSRDSVFSFCRGHHWNKDMRSCEKNGQSGDMRRHSPSRGALFLWLFLLSNVELIKYLKWWGEKYQDCFTDKREWMVYCAKRRAPPAEKFFVPLVIYG